VDAYHSWERGANENTNGLIRQYFPKGTDFGDITQEQVMRVQNILNSRPRKRLGYMTPIEKFKQLTNLDYNAVALYA
jgi:transposase, IS30 family